LPIPDRRKCAYRMGFDEERLDTSSNEWHRSATSCIGMDAAPQPPNERKYTWEELQAIESRRRAILKQTELPCWKILTLWDGTCLHALATDWLIWTTIAIYISIRIEARFTDAMPVYAANLANTDIAIIGGFLSFFVVLFVNQSNTRFHDMYKTSMNCSSKVYDVASLVATAFPRASALRIVRYMNAAHAAAYVGLNRTYSKREFFDKMNDTLRFLGTEEMKRINITGMDDGADACYEMTGWCMMDVHLAFKEGHVNAYEAEALKEKIIEFRGNVDTLYDYCDQPIHFFYIHFLCLLSALYLPLFAVDNAYGAGVGEEVHWTLDLVALLIVLLQSIFVIGLRLLGQKMIDPYGDDLEDLSVMYYVKSTWQRSNRILVAQLPGPVSPELEEGLDRQKESIGFAWEKSKGTASFDVGGVA
jgi:predicted membrane chloride channel (bestrophin family)